MPKMARPHRTREIGSALSNRTVMSVPTGKLRVSVCDAGSKRRAASHFSIRRYGGVNALIHRVIRILMEREILLGRWRSLRQLRSDRERQDERIPGGCLHRGRA